MHPSLSQPDPFPEPRTGGAGVGRLVVGQVPVGLRVRAAERLVSVPDRARAAKNLVETAEQHGINLEMLWGAYDPVGGSVAQVCLAVASAGRTAMLFLSAPGSERWMGTASQQQGQLAAVLRTALREIPGVSGANLGLAQTLIEPDHAWAEAACRDAGMVWVGRLQFMRLGWPVRYAPVGAWPAGVTVTRVGDPTDFSPGGDGSALARALERSYERTQDCPELCGLRATRDVIASHMATGAFDPARWWVIRLNGVAEGCCLLNYCPVNRALELVYLGLSVELRGMGLARRVLEHALSNSAVRDAREVTCAVDSRNTPAVRLYHSMGFRAFGSRVGFVQALATGVVEAKPLSQSDARGQSASIGTSGGQQNLGIAKRL